MIETDWTTETVSFNEQLLPDESIDRKVDLLNEHAEALGTNSSTFFTLFSNIVINENQKGEIVETMQELTREQFIRHLLIKVALINKNKSVITRLESQIDENKTQSISATYYV